MNVRCLALDYGASNGRAILGSFDGKKLSLEELRRFVNEPVFSFTGMQWNILSLFQECIKSLSACNALGEQSLLSVGIDSFGCDFGLIDRNGHLIGNPYHYRDKRVDGVIERNSGLLDGKTLFEMTGNATIKYNTVYQLLAMRPSQSTLLNNAHTMLLIPDLITYLLTGEKITEYTNATTTQLMRKTRDTWHEDVLNKFDLPFAMMPYILQPGTNVGGISEKVSQNVSIGDVQVVATATHDTASAIAATPGLNENSVFLSSGTWSLIGIETEKPIVNDDVYATNFTNEGGLEQKNLLLRNTVGMWILQECMKEWRSTEKTLSYEQLIGEAQACPQFGSVIDTEYHDFAYPGCMPEKVRAYCRRTGQHVPESKAELAHCILESMAFKYRWCFDNIECIAGRRLDTLHIVGGGSQNVMLNQFTANALDRPVICGPAEATAAGNILVQLKSFGEVTSLAQIRQVVRDSFEIQSYMPLDTERWNEAYHRYLQII